MEKVIDPVAVELIEKELTPDKFVRYTNYNNNHIYIFSHRDSPNLMQEVGRLRELAFRVPGGGTGKAADIDKYDLDETNPYKQLIVWDPKEKKILGGYRYLLCNNVPVDENGKAILATSKLFEFSEKFQNQYLSHVIELGRSFVTPEYQSKAQARKGIFTLDNLWDGLATLLVNNPEMKYFFGKVTMYTSYNKFVRDLILFFFKKHMPDKEGLMWPHNPLSYHHNEEELAVVFNGSDFKEDYKILSAKARENGETIPPLINSYMNLSATMVTFGTAMNYNFGAVEETGIMLTIDDIYPTKSKRHISTYLEYLKEKKEK